MIVEDAIGVFLMKDKSVFETFSHKYKLKAKIGEGGPSIVFLVENENEESFALKLLKASAEGTRSHQAF